VKRDDWSKILGWPGYVVFQQEIDEKAGSEREFERKAI